MKSLSRLRLRRPGGRRATLPAAATGAAGAVATTLPLPPLFVGGTGRSGTTIVARLIDAHPAYLMIPTEARFISASGGLCDLADGRTTYDAFVERLLRRWYGPGPGAHLHVLFDRGTAESALAALRDGLASDPLQAARTFAHRLLDPLASRAGAGGWVEMTPANVRSPATLLRVFPTMRLVHSVRDGRDVAASVVGMGWGPSDVDEALDWWAATLGRAFRSTAKLPPDRIHVVRLEDLTVGHRDHEYQGLLDFAGLADDPAMRTFFDTVMTPGQAHIGRWRDEVPADRLAAFEAHYQRLARGLVEQGHPYDVESPAPWSGRPTPGRGPW